MKNIKQNLINHINNLDENKLKEVLGQLVPENTSKEQEMSDFLFSKLNGVNLKRDGRFLDSQNNILFIVPKNNVLYVSYHQIWSVFESKYKLNYNQIANFIKTWVEANLGWKGLSGIYSN